MDELRLVGRELGCNEATKGVADQIDVPEAHSLEPAAEPGGELGGAQLRPQSGEVEYVDELLSSEAQTDLRPPAPGTRKTMHEHDRWALPRDPVPDRPSFDLYLAELHVNQCVTSGSRRRPSDGLHGGPGARLAGSPQGALQRIVSRQGDEERSRERIAGAECRASLHRLRSGPFDLVSSDGDRAGRAELDDGKVEPRGKSSGSLLWLGSRDSESFLGGRQDDVCTGCEFEVGELRRRQVDGGPAAAEPFERSTTRVSRPGLKQREAGHEQRLIVEQFRDVQR